MGCARHEHEGAACYDIGVAVQSKPIPADHRLAGERKTMDTSSRPRLEQAPICGGRNEKSLLPLKKRATSHELSSADDDSYGIIPPKKIRPVDTGRSEGTYGIIHHQVDMLVTTTAASPKLSRSTTMIEPLEQKKRRRHDGIIRSEVVVGRRRSDDEALHAYYCNGSMEEEAETSAAGAARAKKNSKKKKRPAPAREDGVHRPLPPGLSHHLEPLGATAARFVCKKTLCMSDVNSNQNRLLISCKREFIESHPITALLADNEEYFVYQYEHGLRVIAFDHDGTEYELKLRYLDSNGGYRFIAGWNSFVCTNGLFGPVDHGRRVDVEVWAFRSPVLPEQPLLGEDEQLFVDGLEGHPDGSLGLLLLPYVDDRERRNVHPADEAETMQPLRMRAPPVPKQTKRRRASAKAVQQEKKKKKKKVAADHVSANRGKAVVRMMTLDEVAMAAGPELADPLIGLLMLARALRRSRSRSRA